MHDLVIRGGKIVDGTGAPAFSGDIAVKDGKLVEVGGKIGPARQEIDADGLVITPGFVDTHTHFDGQVTWDPHLSPSPWHGVTTVVMGNCGVGFAPVRAAERNYLIEIMEGVEDIPGTALAEGMTWDWETFPEYLDSLDRQKRAIDVGAQVPHCAVRCYVMGRNRALDDEATDADIAGMAQITTEALQAGALGFSTSRTFIHLTKAGELVPGTHCSPQELVGIAKGMAKAGSGVFQMISDLQGKEPDLKWMKEIARITGKPVVFSLSELSEKADSFEFRNTLATLQTAYDAEGVDIRAAVPWRPPGFMFGLQTALNPFTRYKAYAPIIDLPLEAQLRRMRDPDFRRAVLADTPDMSGSLLGLTSRFDRMFPLGDPPNYEPRPEDSIAARAQAANVTPQEYAYDYLLANEGKNFIFLPVANYSQGNFDILREMLTHTRSISALSDAGAHVSSVCDASFSTFMLTHWARDRDRGARMPLEQVIRKQTLESAALYGLHDRGMLAPGKKADLNIIDFDAMTLHAPYMAYDLPTGGRRVLQKASGFRNTIVSGQVIAENGAMTDALPGRVVRGEQAA